MEQGAAEETMPSVTAEHTVTATATMHPSNTGPTHCSKALPISSEEIAMSAFDDDPSRLLVVQIYNQMCGVLNENEGDAAQSYCGNKSAGLRFRKALRAVELLCIRMRNALFEQPFSQKLDLLQSHTQQQGGCVEAPHDGRTTTTAVGGAKEDAMEEAQSDDALSGGGSDNYADIDAEIDPDSDLEGNPEKSMPQRNSVNVNESVSQPKGNSLDGLLLGSSSSRKRVEFIDRSTPPEHSKIEASTNGGAIVAAKPLVLTLQYKDSSSKLPPGTVYLEDS
jgi:hypothetical protein